MGLTDKVIKDVEFKHGRVSISVALVLVALIVAVPTGWYYLNEVSQDVHTHKTAPVAFSHPDAAAQLAVLQEATKAAADASRAAAQAAEAATRQGIRLERNQMQVQFILERAFPDEARAAKRAVTSIVEDDRE